MPIAKLASRNRCCSAEDCGPRFDEKGLMDHLYLENEIRDFESALIAANAQTLVHMAGYNEIALRRAQQIPLGGRINLPHYLLRDLRRLCPADPNHRHYCRANKSVWR